MGLWVNRLRHLHWTQRRTLWAYAFVLPTFVYFLVVNVGSMLVSFSFSFQKYTTISARRSFVGLDNYRSILQDPTFAQALRNTLVFAALRVPAVTVLSLGVALLLQGIGHAKGFFRGLYFLPHVTSGVAIAWVWKFMYLPYFGIVGPLFDLLRQPRFNVLQNPRTALLSIVVVQVWASVGYHALIFLTGLENIPDAFYDAAKVDGAGAWQRFRYITIPLLNRTIVLVGVLLLISSLNTFTVVRMMSDQRSGGPMGTTRTLPLLIYMEAFGSMNMGRASAMAVLFFVIVLVASLVQRRLLTRELGES